MEHIKVDSDLQKNYDNYYNGESESLWRELGAVDKGKNIINICNNISVDNVLEIGAGDGSLLQELMINNFGKNLFALEISKSGIDVINNKNIKKLKEVKLFDGYRIPYKDNKFDLVILSHVIEHVEHPRILLEEAARVAKYFFVEVPLEDTLFAPKDFKVTRTGHINYYSYKTIRKLLKSCRLNCLNQKVSNPSFSVHKYLYKSKIKTVIKYGIRSCLLKIFPKLAPLFLVYHSYLLLKPYKIRKQL